ncbi:hypothetical protein [Enterococcus durans]|uniref:hypothetical protein n=1 Tax=Enterococcus durans TaxID=53345 RepID=UPI00115BB723|nr:hypothetical protein [Enterococcus durans]
MLTAITPTVANGIVYADDIISQSTLNSDQEATNNSDKITVNSELSENSLISNVEIEDTMQSELIESNDNTAIDIQKMTSEQADYFRRIVSESTKSIENIETSEQQAVATKYMLGVFDSSSVYYQNLSKAQADMQIELMEKFGIQPDIRTMLRFTHVISVGVLATVINTALSFITGGSISAYVKKKGWNMLVNQLQSRVAATIRISQLNKIIGGLSKTIVVVLDPGTYIANLIDNSSYDKIRGNVWIELT